MTRRIGAVILSLFLTAAGAIGSQPPPAQEEYKPIAEVPASEQLPGGAFVVGAYSFIWIATMGYVWFVWRRLRKVEDEMRTLHRSGTGNSGR